jgi:superfamily II DNA helicase RecQ
MRKRNLALPEPELHAILRAADDLIGSAGRSMLAKILKGSKDKKLLELGLDRNPSYGFYKDLTLEQIMEKVDHMILTDFLEIQYSGKLPMIIFTPRGWAVERERRAEEFLREWDSWIENHVVPVSMEYLKERNRGMIFLFLYKVLCSGNKKYVPFLTLWEHDAFKKVQAEIRKVIDALNRRDEMDNSQWESLKKEYAKSLILRADKPILLECQRCDSLFVFDEENPEHYLGEGLRYPTICSRCKEIKK